MSDPPITPEERYTAIAEALLSNPDVTQSSGVTEPKRRFGASGVRVNNKIFAMLVNGSLVVKLPRQRVDALIAAGAGERFDPGHGRLMKEWLTIGPASGDGWLPLASEAMQFVAAQR